MAPGLVLPFWHCDCVFDQLRNFALQRRVRIAVGRYWGVPHEFGMISICPMLPHVSNWLA